MGANMEITKEISVDNPNFMIITKTEVTDKYISKQKLAKQRVEVKELLDSIDADLALFDK